MIRRPTYNNRCFHSAVVDEFIDDLHARIADKDLADMFVNCFPNTLDTTVKFNNKDGAPDTFIITGDINAMWLRDSTAQVWHYLPFVKKDPKLKELIHGLLNRQLKSVQIDPYANAFNDTGKESVWSGDLTEMKPEVYERKWEVDSLCYVIRLAYEFYKTTDNKNYFTKDWKISFDLIVKTFKEQQRKNGRGPYKFGRITSWSTDTVPGDGYGNPIKPNGMIVSIFRPSDDATIFPFLVPSNLFAVKSLRQLSEIYNEIYEDKTAAIVAANLADEIENAVYKYAVTEHLNYGKIFAYEIDGFGNRLFMDDANIPSLLSLPYLGIVDCHDELYLNTRKFVLSENNPYYFVGKAGDGIGSPHTLINRIWHLSIIMRALTSNNEDEIAHCLKLMKNTHADTWFMHESFDKDNPYNYTRSWFAWANSLFGELIVKINNDYPDLLNRIY
ncbi:glycoside hydrolase family 125 protein [Melioribacter sp. Ez-97]|uniref:glycoside hydrolase family 125 protein n=1 Tax=Melioribacter sp. Ez-97 TaxID=3423434 RepID=UPI003ED8B97B